MCQNEVGKQAEGLTLIAGLTYNGSDAAPLLAAGRSPCLVPGCVWQRCCWALL